MSKAEYALLQDVIMDADFPDLDLALRRGRHVDRDDAAWYSLLTDAQELLEPFYRRYGCELIHKTDGYFYLLPTGDKVSRKQLSPTDMLVGQALALLYLDPSAVERGGVVSQEDIVGQLSAVLGSDALIGLFSPGKRKKQDERIAQRNVRQRVAEAVRRLAGLGFVELSDASAVRLRAALLRFAEPVRGLSEPAEALAKLVAQGEVALTPEGSGEGLEDSDDDADADADAALPVADPADDDAGELGAMDGNAEDAEHSASRLGTDSGDGPGDAAAGSVHDGEAPLGAKQYGEAPLGAKQYGNSEAAASGARVEGAAALGAVSDDRVAAATSGESAGDSSAAASGARSSGSEGLSAASEDGVAAASGERAGLSDAMSHGDLAAAAGGERGGALAAASGARAGSLGAVNEADLAAAGGGGRAGSAAVLGAVSDDETSAAASGARAGSLGGMNDTGSSAAPSGARADLATAGSGGRAQGVSTAPAVPAPAAGGGAVAAGVDELSATDEVAMRGAGAGDAAEVGLAGSDALRDADGPGAGELDAAALGGAAWDADERLGAAEGDDSASRDGWDESSGSGVVARPDAVDGRDDAEGAEPPAASTRAPAPGRQFTPPADDDLDWANILLPGQDVEDGS